ncbi:hypothetical protein M5K25_014917 [Dendrobium thyrsiflorum]|uniref:Uncharacterized protein n=1 Tax=Dendrobium thyrsiflorum TaxID=117978 RepID=A0ABD0UP94_DENTH
MKNFSTSPYFSSVVAGSVVIPGLRRGIVLAALVVVASKGVHQRSSKPRHSYCSSASPSIA